ncbi:MAG: hypothetical protein AAFV96_13515, partial [Pseudomonadota bacterium]
MTAFPAPIAEQIWDMKYRLKPAPGETGAAEARLPGFWIPLRRGQGRGDAGEGGVDMRFRRAGLPRRGLQPILHVPDLFGDGG